MWEPMGEPTGNEQSYEIEAQNYEIVDEQQQDGQVQGIDVRVPLYK